MCTLEITLNPIDRSNLASAFLRKTFRTHIRSEGTKSGNPTPINIRPIPELNPNCPIIYNQHKNKAPFEVERPFHSYSKLFRKNPPFPSRLTRPVVRTISAGVTISIFPTQLMIDRLPVATITFCNICGHTSSQYQTPPPHKSELTRETVERVRVARTPGAFINFIISCAANYYKFIAPPGRAPRVRFFAPSLLLARIYSRGLATKGLFPGERTKEANEGGANLLIFSSSFVHDSVGSTASFLTFAAPRVIPEVHPVQQFLARRSKPQTFRWPLRGGRAVFAAIPGSGVINYAAGVA